MMSDAEVRAQAVRNVEAKRAAQAEAEIVEEVERLRRCERDAFVGSKLREHSVRQREERAREP